MAVAQKPYLSEASQESIVVLRPGFEPGINGSKGHYACPDYTTGARETTKRRKSAFIILVGRYASLNPAAAPRRKPAMNGTCVETMSMGPSPRWTSAQVKGRRLKRASAS